jgi:hypothetical protein
MTGRAACLCTMVVALAGCSSSGSAPSSGAPSDGGGPGTISGAVTGTSWTTLANAYWIGKPGLGSAPIIVFLFETPVMCSTITNFNWDKTAIGDSQLLEIAVKEVATKTFQIPVEAGVAYLKGFYNPDADMGTVTISQINPMQNIVGSFDAKFMTDSLTGTFDATYCADGVEP